MPEQISRREMMKTGVVGTLAAAAGCYTQQDDSGGALLPGAGASTYRIGDWPVKIVEDIDGVDSSDTPMFAIGTSGEEAIIVDEAKLPMSTTTTTNDGNDLLVQLVDDIGNATTDDLPSLVIDYDSGVSSMYLYQE